MKLIKSDEIDHDFEVIEGEEKERLDKYITSKIGEQTRSQIQFLILNSRVRLNNAIERNCGKKIKIGDSFSQEQGLLYGVPQGSVLGPRLFNIYIRSLYSYIADTKFNIEGFADDHQLVKQFVVTMQPIALGHNIRNCLAKISDWMSKYFLCLNEDKTKIMVIAPPAVKKKLIICTTTV